MVPAMELPYLAKQYRIKLSRSRMAFQLIDTKFGANLPWTNGVHLTNAILEMSVPLPARMCPFGKWPNCALFSNSPFCGNQNSVRIY